jgi:hypothetical protein
MTGQTITSVLNKLLGVDMKADDAGLFSLVERVTKHLTPVNGTAEIPSLGRNSALRHSFPHPFSLTTCILRIRC